MRLSRLAAGAVIGAGLAYWAYASRRAEPTAFREAPEPPHEIQSAEDREDVAALIDEVVHEPGVPNTPVKQAFEHALEER